MKTSSMLALAACALFLTSAQAFQEDKTKSDDSDSRAARSNAAAPYAIGLWGDVPYSVAQVPGVWNMIADMNDQNLAFTVNDGDLKAGGGACNDSVYTEALAYLNTLWAPAAFTPGDNDWTDCDRVVGFSSIAQLDKERTLFFSTPFTLGVRKMLQDVQATPLCQGYNRFTPCVENRRWTYGKVTYVTLNVQGSCNNLCDTSPDPVEYGYRNAANIAWLKDAFADAKKKESVAVMIISQADPGFDLSDSTRAPIRDSKTLAETVPAIDGFREFLLAVRAETVAFGKPVAYVHGDSHYFRVDKPLQDALGQRLENFTRVETFGDNAQNGTNDVQWVKVLVDPRSREVFAYQPQIVPANRVAVPVK
ncbi:MAG: hypothetical protein ABIR70_10530 [Bryobacteraceae bacterium]